MHTTGGTLHPSLVSSCCTIGVVLGSENIINKVVVIVRAADRPIELRNRKVVRGARTSGGL